MSSYSIKYLIDANDKLTPVLRKIKTELKAVDKIAKGLAKPLKMTIDAKKIRAELAKIKKMAALKGSLKISVNTAQVKSELAKIKAAAKIDVTLKAKKSSLGTLSPITVKVNLDLTHARTQLAQLAAHILNIGVNFRGGGGSGLGGSTSRREGIVGRGEVAAAGSVAVGVVDAIDMDRAMTSLEKATNASESALSSFKAMAIGMETETGKSASSFVQMITDASKAGVAVENLNRSVRDGATVSMAWDLSVEDTSDALTHIRSGLYSDIKAFDAQQDAVMKTAATIAYLADTTEASERYLANYIGRTAGLTTAFNQNQDTILAAGSAFEAIGIAPEVAARAMNSAGASFGNFIKKLKKDSPILARMGMTKEQVEKATSADMTGMLFKIAKSMDALPEMEKMSAMAEIFGVGFADELIRFGSAMPIFEKNLAKANSKLAQSTTLNEQATIQMASMSTEWDRFVEGTKTVLGTGVKEYLTDFVEIMADLLEWLKQHPLVVQFAFAIGGLALAYWACTAAATALAGASMLLIAANIILIGLVLLISAVFIGAYENSETLRGALSDLWKALGEVGLGFGGASEEGNFFKNALKGIGIAIGIVITALTIMVVLLQTAMQVFTQFISGDWGAMGDTIADGLERADGILERMAKRIDNDLIGSKLTIEQQAEEAKQAEEARKAAGLAAFQQGSLPNGISNAATAAIIAAQTDAQIKAAEAAKKAADEQAALTKKQGEAAVKSMQASDALIEAAGLLKNQNSGQSFAFLGFNR